MARPLGLLLCSVAVGFARIREVERVYAGRGHLEAEHLERSHLSKWFFYSKVLFFFTTNTQHERKWVRLKFVSHFLIFIASILFAESPEV
jgi:hypothetical protein